MEEQRLAIRSLDTNVSNKQEGVPAKHRACQSEWSPENVVCGLETQFYAGQVYFDRKGLLVWGIYCEGPSYILISFRCRASKIIMMTLIHQRKVDMMISSSFP